MDVVIVGAGPYGLSVATHLRRRRVPFRIFGRPLAFWRDMPDGLFLKSLGFATTIANPEGLTYDGWCREHHLEDVEPCSMESFTEYGLWLQQKLVPEVEDIEVTRIESANGGFRIGLSSGEQLDARHVVIAVGLRHFQRLPSSLAGLPRALASHTMDHKGYHEFRDKDVCVIGAGSSALEAAILLHECGARPQLLVRSRPPIIYTRTPVERSLLARLLKPMSVLGEGKLSWTLEHVPLGPYFLPDVVRVWLTRRHLGPAGAWWARDRFVGKVPVHAHCEILGAREEGGGVVLRLREQGMPEHELRADHVVAGTGFAVDVDRLPFLAGDLRARIARIERAPRLDRHFESSVRGLHFVGVMSAFSFGPLFRFICGTTYTAPTLARYLALQRQGPR